MWCSHPPILFLRLGHHCESSLGCRKVSCQLPLVWFQLRLHFRSQFFWLLLIFLLLYPASCSPILNI
ncbi:hypothetical protein DNK06_07835 [Pseudomonas daroniae]|uniref:ATP synthase YMF19-like N-terminal domain-containing protein n=1 Tax=Phytopseudomonas daroniae TaxID=2487519 RepID=A0A4Q9QML5_9GAMM|nr:hypothetical protein DNK06_07835 [Pseudomonas daroniae]TBU83546.1 hypothetical protein DNK31_08600 [Pseudomonas sp. FRB 228]TBU87463.1 hypothetical protein DNJ99_21725 [Pseudomonas daroniae]